MDSLRLDKNPAPVGNPIKTDSSSASVASAKPQQEVALPNPNAGKSQQVTAASIDNARAELVVMAARTVSNYFVVSDVKFTIFKDNQGTFVTKFTNLQDGSVSYYPEQELFRLYSQISGQPVSLVDTDA